jgi:hypothetical protein
MFLVLPCEREAFFQGALMESLLGIISFVYFNVWIALVASAGESGIMQLSVVYTLPAVYWPLWCLLVKQYLGWKACVLLIKAL